MSFNIPLTSFPYGSWSIVHEGLNEPNYPAGLANGDIALISVKYSASDGGGYPTFTYPTNNAVIALSDATSFVDGKGGTVFFRQSAGVFYRQLVSTDSNSAIGGNQTSGYFYILRNNQYNNTATLNSLALETSTTYNNTAPFGISEPSVLSCFAFTAVSTTTTLSANAALFDGTGPSTNNTVGAGTQALSSLTIEIQDQYASNTAIVQGITAGSPTQLQARPFYVETS